MAKEIFDDVDSVVKPAKDKKSLHHVKHSTHTSTHKPEYLEHKQHNKGKKFETMTWIFGILSAVLIIALVAAIVTNGFSGKEKATAVSKEELQTQVKAYIDNLIQGQAAVTIESIEDTGELYLIKLDVGGQKLDSYATKDGKLWFPQGMDLTGNAPATPQPNAQAQQPPTVPKTDKPTVELFVMSHCPYGTQTEKGILPAVRTLGDKIDFKIRFVYYAMHGKVEIDEQTRQYCIQKEQTDKFIPYLACFLNKSDNSANCLTQTGVDTTKLDACIVTADTEFDISKNFADQASWLSGRFPKYNVDLAGNTKYGVQGSPTLIINGAEASAGRDAASMLAAMCAGFNTAPGECQTQLSSVTPGPGFGYDSTGSAQAAGCGV